MTKFWIWSDWNSSNSSRLRTTRLITWVSTAWYMWKWAINGVWCSCLLPPQPLLLGTANSQWAEMVHTFSQRIRKQTSAPGWSWQMDFSSGGWAAPASREELQREGDKRWGGDEDRRLKFCHVLNEIKEEEGVEVHSVVTNPNKAVGVFHNDTVEKRNVRLRVAVIGRN